LFVIPFLKWLLSRFLWRNTGLLTITVLIGGCDRDEVKSYSVPKEQPSQSAEASLPPDHPDIASAAGMPSLKWTTPDGWKETPPGDMRVASFRVTGQDGKQADVSVIPLPGEAGSDLSNVNRWRSQVEQEPVSEGELGKLAQPVEVAGQPATLYEQNGQNSTGDPTRILAVIQRRDGTAWFFKMTGDAVQVAAALPAFDKLIDSLTPAAK